MFVEGPNKTKPLTVAIVSEQVFKNRDKCSDANMTNKIGGSLTGLLCGVALKHAGHAVRILEQHGNDRESQATGLGLGPSAQTFLQHHDRIGDCFSHTVTSLKILGLDGTVRHLATGRRDITSWDAFYYRLRSLFDGYISPYYPVAPETSETDGLVTYDTHKKVVNISRSDTLDAPIDLSIVGSKPQELEHFRADVVIGADGPNSCVRDKYMSNVRRQYVGYIMWRGLVPENEVTLETRELFESAIIVHKSGQQHCIMYMIPGTNGSLERGERFLNFMWYTNESPEDLDKIMVDSLDGHLHHNFVPQGRVRDDIWTSRLQAAQELPLPGPFLDVATKIKKPSIQVVTDFCSMHAAFEDGRVLLIGDALSQFRPHAALGVSQAAFHATAVADYLSGKLSLQQWEGRVVRQSYLHWSLNAWWGSFYQKSLVAALPSALRYWVYNGLYQLTSWWKGDLSLS